MFTHKSGVLNTASSNSNMTIFNHYQGCSISLRLEVIYYKSTHEYIYKSLIYMTILIRIIGFVTSIDSTTNKIENIGI